MTLPLRLRGINYEATGKVWQFTADFLVGRIPLFELVLGPAGFRQRRPLTKAPSTLMPILADAFQRKRPTRRCLREWTIST